jgi:hypothetical protein
VSALDLQWLARDLDGRVEDEPDEPDGDDLEGLDPEEVLRRLREEPDEVFGPPWRQP